MRFTGGRVIEADCPVCGLPLPPIAVEYEARGDGPRTLTVDVSAPLTDAWWAEVDALHPGCRTPP